jgi:hypothetical protein
MEHVDINKAHDELIEKLFCVPANTIGSVVGLKISRSFYTKCMEAVQDKYGLKQGHPQFLEWVLTCVGRSPIIIEDEEGAGEDGK